MKAIWGRFGEHSRGEEKDRMLVTEYQRHVMPETFFEKSSKRCHRIKTRQDEMN